MDLKYLNVGIENEFVPNSEEVNSRATNLMTKGAFKNYVDKKR